MHMKRRQQHLQRQPLAVVWMGMAHGAGKQGQGEIAEAGLLPVRLSCPVGKEKKERKCLGVESSGFWLLLLLQQLLPAVQLAAVRLAAVQLAGVQLAALQLAAVELAVLHV